MKTLLKVDGIQGSDGYSIALPLDLTSIDGNLGKLLESLKIKSLKDLWLLLVLEELSNQQGLNALCQVSKYLASIISPFLPSYEIDYSISISSENEKSNLDWLHQTTYEVAIKLPDMVVRSSGIVPSILEERYNVQENPLDILEQVKKSADTYCDHEEDQIYVKPLRLPVLNTILGSLTEIQRNVVIGRYGLLSGEVETLEQIAIGLFSNEAKALRANNGPLTRERIRQIEVKASRRIRHPTKWRTLKKFRSYFYDFISEKNDVVSSMELLEKLSPYIEYGEYKHSMSMAFVSSFSDLYVERPHEENDIWFAASSEECFRKFEQTVKLVTGLDLKDKIEKGLLTSQNIVDILAIMRLLSLDEIESIQDAVERIIGSSRVMRLEDFISCLTREHPKTKYLINNDKTGGNIYRLLLMTGRVFLIKAAEYEKQLLGYWVVLKLTDRVESIIRAIIYAGANQTVKSVCDLSCLKHGTRLDFIVQYMASRTGFIMNEHSVSEICRRNPEIFVQTDENRWGLIGCGAIRNEHVSERNSRDERIVNVMTRALLVTKDGLTVQELIQQVREAVPNASESTIRIYLATLHRGRFEMTANARYVLSKRYLTHLADSTEQEPVISLVVRVLKEANNPLYIDEIIERCQQYQFVTESAIRGYLTQNYKELFQKHEDGKYSLLGLSSNAREIP